jgi:Fe-S cluster biogenesis protein NfuA/nitrite reductase/ring-hydroxylating ferredoxin subunit
VEVSNKQAFQEQLGRIEGLIQTVEQMADPAAQAASRELVQALLDVHGTALERMLEIIFDTVGQPLIDDLGRDDIVSGLLLMHGLHPLSLEARVLQALDKVRPYLSSHGGNVELLDVTPDGEVRLRLEGSCHGCPSSQMTLRYAIEEAVYKAAPDVTGIQVEGVVEEQAFTAPGNFVPRSDLVGQNTFDTAGGDGWVAVEDLMLSLEGCTVRTIDVSGRLVLFCRVGETLYAYGSTCPHCNQVLSQAILNDRHLICAACGHHYDVMQAGRDLEAPGLYLEPYPLLEEQGQAKVALPWR